MLTDPATVAVIFTVILHAILVASAFGIILLIYGVIAEFPAPAGRLKQEILMRSIAARPAFCWCSPAAPSVCPFHRSC